MNRPTELVIDPSIRAVRRALLSLAVGLGVASALAQVAKYELDVAGGVANLFDANQEANLPTLYSTLALGLSACLLAAVGGSARDRGSSTRWFALSGLFAVATVDEAAGLHELLNDPLRSLLGSGGVLSYPWIVPGAALSALVVVIFRRFVARLPLPVRRRAVTGALVFAAGALAVESVENLIADASAGPSLAAALVGTLSEVCEMLGVVLILEALLLYISRVRGSVTIAIRPVSTREKALASESP